MKALNKALLITGISAISAQAYAQPVKVDNQKANDEHSDILKSQILSNNIESEILNHMSQYIENSYFDDNKVDFGITAEELKALTFQNEFSGGAINDSTSDFGESGITINTPNQGTTGSCHCHCHCHCHGSRGWR